MSDVSTTPTDRRSGQCLCGAVHFSITGADQDVGACHCKMCQRWTGSAFLTVTTPKDNFELESGEKSLRTYSSSAWAERAFCGTCGSCIFYRVTAPGPHQGIRYVAAGTLDDADGLRLGARGEGLARLRAGICAVWWWRPDAGDPVRQRPATRVGAVRRRKPLRPLGCGGMGPSSVPFSFDNGHRIAISRSERNLDPWRSQRSPRNLHHGLLSHEIFYDKRSPTFDFAGETDKKTEEEVMAEFSG